MNRSDVNFLAGGGLALVLAVGLINWALGLPYWACAAVGFAVGIVGFRLLLTKIRWRRASRAARRWELRQQEWQDR